MLRPSSVWLASCAAAVGALVVTAGVLAAHRTESDRDAIHPDRLSERGFVAPRSATPAAGPSEATSDAISDPSKRSPLAMRLKDEGEDPTSTWPPGFHATPGRPTPLTMCLKHDTVDGTPICPNAHSRDARRNALTMPLR
jgi:hypothetical protein